MPVEPGTQQTKPPEAGRAAQLFYRSLAVASLFLAGIGVFLPLLPTVPFVLLAAWAASRGAPELQRAILRHPRFGPLVRDWHETGSVPRRAKWLASVMMSLSAVLMVLVVRNPWVLVPALSCMGCVLVWLWLRPEK